MNDTIINLIIFLVLMIIGYVFGTLAEKRHYASIKEREEKHKELMIIAGRRIPKNLMQNADPHMVTGSVVVSVDYFKRFLAVLRNIVGGRVSSFETLLDRGRREAILRMKEEAAAKGGKFIFNVKLETSSISKGQGKSIGSIEVLAYGTALSPAVSAPAPAKTPAA